MLPTRSDWESLIYTSEELGQPAPLVTSPAEHALSLSKGTAECTSLSSRPGGPEPNVSPAREGWVSMMMTSAVGAALLHQHHPFETRPGTRG
jgi:hypothetical protein